MTNLLRKIIGIVLLVILATPIANPSISAQTALDGSGCWQPGQLSISGASMAWSTPPATIIDRNETYHATLHTSAGTVEIDLDAANAPLATNNFLCLALAGYYNGTDFHRIFADTLVQGGDPTASGTGNPGYTIPSDPTTGSYPPGSVAMANAGPDRNGSQFFIALTDLTDAIPDQYPVFGQIVAGLETVRSISNGAVTTSDSGELSKPVDPSILSNITITTGSVTDEPAGPPITPTVVTTPAPNAITDSGYSRPDERPAFPAQATMPLETGCTGLEDYRTAFDDAYFQAAMENDEALAFLVSLQNSENSESMFTQMNADQATAMSAFYYAVADVIERITPPAFAAEWHNVQIEIFQALGQFTANIASQGLTLASVQSSSRLNDLAQQSDMTLTDAAGVCLEFRSWANGEDPA